MTPQQQWDRAQIKLKALYGMKLSEHPMRLQWDRRRVELWKAANPRKRKVPKFFELDTPGLEAEQNQWQARADALFARYQSAKDRWTNELKQAAEGLEVRPGDTWNKADERHSSSYRSQGYGAETYAKGSAESAADFYRALGLEVEIRSQYRKYEGARQWPFGSTTYEVWVKADPQTIEICEYKPAISLREQVRLCWARGVQPRVFMPNLPVGFEEKNGLDYFGNDLRLTAATC